MLKPYISKVINETNLTQQEAFEAMEIIMTGQASSAQIGGYLVGLRMKGETVDEITGSAMALHSVANRIKPEVDAPLLDIVGTGGDGAHTINISTAAAFVIAGAGYPVAKHGNRAASSKCGSADVLEALDVNLDLQPQQVSECIEEVGIGFMFAPLFHPAMKHAIGPRRELGQRTIFNILGPLTNPAGAQRQILGVFADKLTETLALVLGNLGAVDAVVVHGEDGLDEVSISGRTKVSRFRDGSVHNFTIEPEDFGIWKNNIEQIRGGDKEENAAITVSVLKGEKGPRRDIVLMNSALALIAAGKTEDFKTAFQEAADTIDSERAFRKFEEIKKFSNSL